MSVGGVASRNLGDVVGAYSPGRRTARPRRYVMCEPLFFDVRYRINEWMDPLAGVDLDLAQYQWNRLRAVYLELGHEVELIDPEPDLPDMVFAANGALAIGDRILGASFAHPERRHEATLHQRRFRSGRFRELAVATHVNEGEGDFLVAGDVILAGCGFRTVPEAHREAQEFFGIPVISLQLVDSRFYHLDTALAVLDECTIAYYPRAFSKGSRRVLEHLFPDALLVEESDALVLALNAVSDGANVILPVAAADFSSSLIRRGFTPIPVDLSELLKAGGSVKCCTMELHP